MDLLRSQLDTLASTPLFSEPTYHLSQKRRAFLSYERAKAIARCYVFTVDDITSLTPKFWELLTHPINTMDTATSTLLIIQINLTAGIIAQYSQGRPDLSMVINDLLTYSYHGTFLLTEVGHGLDATNLETVAMATSDGYILHTPTESACKYMATVLPAGQPCVGIVYARLVVQGEDRGVRPFVVQLNDGKKLTEGISVMMLPYRGGVDPMNHCLTSFDHVRLPQTALLGSPERSPSPRLAFLQSISRVANGTIATACATIPMLEVCATIATLYSLRRTVGNPPVPIISFRTQHKPILVAVAQAYVLRALRHWVIAQFMDTKQDIRVRAGVGTCFKTVMIQHLLSSTTAVSERCGAQGLFAYNQMTNFYNTMRGTAVAEGEVLALSTRLYTDLLLGRYALPAPQNLQSLLARHEHGLFKEHSHTISSFSTHESDGFSNQLIPCSQFTVESIGHRMAFDAAVLAGVDHDLVSLYEADVINQDASWYTTHASLTREGMNKMCNEAMDRLLPKLESLVDAFRVQAYVTAPIRSRTGWKVFLDQLELIGGREFGRTREIAAKL